MRLISSLTALCAAALFTSQAIAAPLILATKSFTEQHILSAMTVQYLQKKGFQVQPQTNIATVISRNAMINKQIDMTWEYTGTSLIIFNHINKRMSPQESYETVKRLDAKHGLVWLNPADMNNTYAFAMQRKRAEAEHINTMSEMVAKIEQIRKTDPDKNWLLGLDLEFAGRSDGMKPLQAAYNMELDRPQIRQMDPGLVYNAVRDGFVDAGLIYTTDGRVISRNAMINKQIDMTWEYTGTSLIIFNHINKRMSPQESYETVKRLDAKHGLVWLNPADMNNTYAFAMQRKRAEAEHINTMSEMVAKIEQIRKTDPDKNWLLGLDLEFAGRSDGMKPLQAAYNMELDRPQIRQMDPGLVYNAVRDGFVDAGLIYTTDGRVKGFDLKVLEDDKGFFPSYAVTPVVRKDTLDANPGLKEALNTLSAQLNNDVITELNKKVDIDHQSPQQVARDFLRSKQLL